MELERLCANATRPLLVYFYVRGVSYGVMEWDEPCCMGTQPPPYQCPLADASFLESADSPWKVARCVIRAHEIWKGGLGAFTGDGGKDSAPNNHLGLRKGQMAS